MIMIANCPSVSVIVPFFNASPTLEECLNSISSQVGVDLEVVMVDDGSTDGSGHVAERYALSDHRFRYIKQDNSGVSAARNAGMAAALGDYVSFVDADDILLPNGLNVLLGAVDSNTDLVIASNYAFRRMGPFKVRTRFGLLNDSVYSFGGIRPLDSFDSALSTPWAKLYRSQMLKTGSIRFETGVPIGEDTRFNIEYCKHAEGVLRTISTAVYDYALGGGASTKSFYPKIISYYTGLYDAYASSVPLFSEEYVYELWERFKDSALLHLYSHTTRAEARAIATQEISTLLSRAPYRRTREGKEPSASLINDPESWISVWEYQNRKRILKSRIKRGIRKRVLRRIGT